MRSLPLSCLLPWPSAPCIRSSERPRRRGTRGAAAFGFLHGTVESESFGMIRRADGTVELQGVGSTTIQQGATGAPSSQPDSDYVQPEGMDVDSGGLTANTDSPGGSGDECIDTTRGTYGFRESDVHEWWMNWTSIPDYFGLSDSTVVDRIREGGAHITNETTDCTNFRPNYPINLDYKGSTSANTDMGWVDGSFVCWPSQNPRDGQNTIDFGDMPPTFAAGTCNYRHSYSSTELTESDIRINEDQGDVRFYATNGKPSSCDSRYDLEGIVTHERGHTFGLVDLLYSSHPDLTMRDMAPGSCSRELRTLGLGDLYGLNDLYA